MLLIYIPAGACVYLMTLRVLKSVGAADLILLYRPVQDCSRTYEERIVLTRVMTLTPSEFKEVLSGIIEPDKNSAYPDEGHTVSTAGNFTLVDGKRTTFTEKGIKAFPNVFG